MGIFETFKHSYLIRDLMLFLIVQLFVQLEIWSIVSLFNYFCSIVVCSIVELFYWLLWSKFFVQLTFVESVFCSIVLFNWSCSIWSRSTDMEGFLIKHDDSYKLKSLVNTRATVDMYAFWLLLTLRPDGAKMGQTETDMLTI